MPERYHRINNNTENPQVKMENEFSSKKTMFILVIVVGCFAVLWPKVFYPMLLGTANQHLKPNDLDKTNGCCYVLSETDVDTIKIMSELCRNIIKNQGIENETLNLLSGKQILSICQNEVLNTCGIDISTVLQERVLLGHTTKQILAEIRSMNGSLCLKYNFGVQPWRLGVPHLITLKNFTERVRQERPPHPHVRSEMLHPAFRERGRAIPQTNRAPPRIIEGRPGPIPGMRPTMGGAGHVVQPSKTGTGSMSVIMPIYTIGIVIFFTYTLMKIIFKKHPETDTIYSHIENDTITSRYHNKKDAFGDHRGVRDAGSCNLGWKERDAIVNAVSALLEEVDQEIEARRLSNMQDEHSNGNLSNGNIAKKEEKPSVKIVGMETTESCEDGKKWQTSNQSSVVPLSKETSTSVENLGSTIAQEIVLDRKLTSKSRILVSDSAIETEKKDVDDEDSAAVVLAGKMTLSVISLENDENNKLELKDEISGIIEEAIENIGNGKIEKTPLVRAKSSSEDSGSTVLSNQSSVINLNDRARSESKPEENVPQNRNGSENINGNMNNNSESDEEIIEEVIEEIYTDDEENGLNGDGN